MCEYICMYVCVCMCVWKCKKVLVTQLCLPFVTPWAVASVHGILSARILEWFAIPFSRGFSQPTDQTQVSHIADGFFAIWAIRGERESECECESEKLFQCPTLCNPMDYSPPGYSVHRIIQARILERVAMPFSRGSSWPRNWTHISYISCIGRQVPYH